MSFISSTVDGLERFITLLTSLQAGNEEERSALRVDMGKTYEEMLRRSLFVFRIANMSAAKEEKDPRNLALKDRVMDPVIKLKAEFGATLVAIETSRAALEEKLGDEDVAFVVEHILHHRVISTCNSALINILEVHQDVPSAERTDLLPDVHKLQEEFGFSEDLAAEILGLLTRERAIQGEKFGFGTSGQEKGNIRDKATYDGKQGGNGALGESV